jgi:regulator of sirC expression with transglutaminase-like and TPR domain
VAIAKGDAVAARVALDDHERLYPKGVLREEAAVPRVEILARLDDPAATRAAAQCFVRTCPESAYAELVRSIAIATMTVKPDSR